MGNAQARAAVSPDGVDVDSRLFWERYAQREVSDHSLMNLEPDAERSRQKFEYELGQIVPWLPRRPDRMIDLGAGVGLWTVAFAGHARRVVAVEREPRFVHALRDRVRQDRLWNVDVVAADVAELELAADSVDVIFLSGVSLYLSDARYGELLAAAATWLRPGGRLIHRDAIGVRGRYELRRKFSDRLDEHYSAIYRELGELRAMHAREGLQRSHWQFMYPDDSAGNRWQETRLQFAIYEKGSEA
jgi:precorrin-6B methylase 2